MTYFVIHQSEDGEMRVEVLRKETLEANLAEGYWGKCRVLHTIPRELDAGPWLAIIKGDLVVPKPVEVVTQYELP